MEIEIDSENESRLKKIRKPPLLLSHEESLAKKVNKYLCLFDKSLPLPPKWPPPSPQDARLKRVNEKKDWTSRKLATPTPYISFLPYPVTPQSGRHMCIIPKSFFPKISFQALKAYVGIVLEYKIVQIKQFYPKCLLKKGSKFK